MKKKFEPLSIPSLKDLENTYSTLSKPTTLPAHELIKYAAWSRFDPRLGEILVQYLQKFWMKQNPLALREENMRSQFPQIFLVLLEHVKCKPHGDKKIFSYFKSIIEQDIHPVPYQSFTIGVFNLGGSLLFRKALRPHPFFKKWGFYESDPFFGKNLGKKIGTQMDKITRKNILRQILTEKKVITVNDYLEACHFAVDRRQAERDLNTFYNLKKTGNTRGRKYMR